MVLLGLLVRRMVESGSTVGLSHNYVIVVVVVVDLFEPIQLRHVDMGMVLTSLVQP